MDALLWPIVLLVVGMLLAVLEFLVPSGGLLGVLATLSLLISVGMAFGYGPWTGLSFLAVVVLALPVLMVLAVRVWPHTPFGRRILLNTPEGDEVLPNSELRSRLKSLIGKTGVARSLLIPGGAVDIDGHTIDAISEGQAIEPGQRVRVIEVRGTRVVVRPSETAAPDRSSDDPLSQPIENFGLDPFEDEEHS